jgi:hypothetical protein
VLKKNVERLGDTHQKSVRMRRYGAWSSQCAVTDKARNSLCMCVDIEETWGSKDNERMRKKVEK